MRPQNLDWRPSEAGSLSLKKRRISTVPNSAVTILVIESSKTLGVIVVVVFSISDQEVLMW